MPLRVRLSLLVAVAVAILATAGGLVFVHQLQTGMDRALDATLRARAETLVQRVGPDGGTDFQDAGATGLLPPNEALTQIISGTGALLESSEGAANSPLLSPSQLAIARTHALSLTSAAGKGSIRLLAVSVPDSGSPPTVVVVGTTRELTEQAVGRARAALSIGAPLGVLASALGAWLLAGAALRPVERMRRQAEAITAGSTARLTVPPSRDEVARLGATINALLERLHSALSQQRDFVADAGHELRTPLTALRAELELATRAGRTRQELFAAVTRAAGDTDHLIRLAESLLLLARTEEADAVLAQSRLRLDTLAAQSAAAARLRSPTPGVDIHVDAPTPVTVAADHDRMLQVIDNLVDNALRYAPPASTVTVRVAPANAAGRVVLEVSDQGAGFPADFLPHAFERFRRADTARTREHGGAGLGLAIVASLVRAHGGSVGAENRADGGATVRVLLPTAAPPPAAAAATDTPLERGRESRREVRPEM